MRTQDDILHALNNIQLSLDDCINNCNRSLERISGSLKEIRESINSVKYTPIPDMPVPSNVGYLYNQDGSFKIKNHRCYVQPMRGAIK